MTAAIHTVTVELDGDGDPWIISFACSGGPEDICHQWCVSCEESCSGVPVLWPRATELVAQAPSGEHQWKPMTSDSCRIVDWLDAVGAVDTYAGEDDEPPMRPGTHRIEEEWTGDNYVWTYADDLQAVTT